MEHGPHGAQQAMNVPQYLLTRFGNVGYFVEAGAHDGVGDSQTLTLEQSGWTGLCVEPSSYYRGLKANRRCRTDNRPLWSCTNARVEFREVIGTELSGVTCAFQDDGWDRDSRPHQDYLRLAVSLADLLDEHAAPPVIQYLALDTEGSELEILRAHDFQGHSFQFVQVEYNGVLSRLAELRALLERHGMSYHGSDGINLFMEKL